MFQVNNLTYSFTILLDVRILSQQISVTGFLSSAQRLCSKSLEDYPLTSAGTGTVSWSNLFVVSTVNFQMTKVLEIEMKIHGGNSSGAFPSSQRNRGRPQRPQKLKEMSINNDH